ncbi:2,5-diamino-6-(ribosylamino)-4(3H)-pyrimidinone 5'-phosphate reductase [Coemansia guatemalensis]|uniref:2,5-diamino-6-ribosylamino-4(3H)-pyrimidinone 5'-phosphate reductase n=1 Tax=Coemansia guatemalensis TaxID=2761395 RepID=A0A9W8HRC8_9FUNG|nr:2,5-diamino-6-(ribosylamino)-4(3H)-pyrimidinone 5'-phosphate reductase [Coemansia guatemalensis]
MDNDAVYAHARDFLSRVPLLSSDPEDCLRQGAGSSRPAVTLTFAQSLDGKISRVDRRLLLSGEESSAMTHRLRAIHDGILVGIGTVLFDDPQLSVRLLPVSELSDVRHPQPIVLDSKLRTPLTARLLTGPQSNPRLHPPWIVTGPGYDRQRRVELERAGARVVVVDDCDESGHPRLTAITAALRRLGIRRLMVEGGARVIQSFLESQLVDVLIVTIAPVLVGSSGVPAVAASAMDSLAITPLSYEPFGRDIVMAATIQHVSAHK